MQVQFEDQKGFQNLVGSKFKIPIRKIEVDTSLLLGL